METLKKWITKEIARSTEELEYWNSDPHDVDCNHEKQRMAILHWVSKKFTLKQVLSQIKKIENDTH